MKNTNPTSVSAINATRGCEKIPNLDPLTKAGINYGRNLGGKLTPGADKIPGADPRRWGKPPASPAKPR